MNEIIQQVEEAVSFVDRAEEANKQLLLRERKLNEEIKQLRDHRDKLRDERYNNIEELKKTAIFLENVAKKYELDAQHSE